MDFFIELLESNIDYKTVIGIVVFYIVSIWFLFSLWVFIDARKRYRNIFFAIIFFLIVLILNFPGLIFYMIIRPDLEDDNILYLEHKGAHSDFGGQGGVNIPLVNFIGENGVDLSLQLRINSTSNNQVSNDLKVNVDLNPNSTNLQMAPVQTSISFNANSKPELSEEDIKTKPSSNKISSLANALKRNVNNLTKNLVQEVSKYGSKMDNDIEKNLQVNSEGSIQFNDIATAQSTKESSNKEQPTQSSQKKKKKKHKNK